MLENWNVDKSRLEKQQQELKANMNFTYIGHGPRATALFAKEFKRKPGLRLLHAAGRARRGELHLRQSAPHRARL